MIQKQFISRLKWSLLTGLALAMAMPHLLHSAPTSGKISIISAEEFSLAKEPVSILDGRNKNAFRNGRIPGSQQVDWDDWTQERPDIFGLWFGKPERAGLSRIPDEALQNELRKLGLSNSKRIVIVGDPHGWGEEGRIAWNLLYWGAEDVALLDGGYPAWAAMASNKPEIGQIKQPLQGTFTIQVQPERRAQVDDVKNAMANNSRSLIDNRSKEEFNGKKFIGQKRGGHIPGALSVPVDTLYGENGLFVTKEGLQHMFTNTPLKNPIAYCVGGVRSALFALLWEAYTGEIVANYDGSMWEWSSHPDLPLE